jgi:type II secretory pathway component PulF
MIFKYDAKDETGTTVSGTLEAESEQAAAVAVRQLGYFPMRFSTSGRASGGVATLENRPLSPTQLYNTSFISPPPTVYRQPFSQKPYGSWFARTFIYPIATGVSAKDLSIFFREFSVMLHAGVPMPRCLQAIADHQGSGLLGTAIRRIQARIESGDSLSNAFAEFPYLFTDLQRAMIAAAEDSGELDLMLRRVSEYLESEFQLREMVKRETFNAKINIVGSIFLPPLYIWVTQGWDAYFHGVVQPSILISIAFIAAYCIARVALRNFTVRLMYDTIKAYIPGIGGMVRMLSLAKFARALSSLYGAGVLIPNAMATAAQVTGNAFLSYQISKSLTALMNGATMSQSLASTGAFPQIFLSMVHTGETTGSVDVMLSKIADFYEDEAKTKINNVVKVIPVVLLLVMGVIVCLEAMKALGGYIGDLNSIMDSN